MTAIIPNTSKIDAVLAWFQRNNWKVKRWKYGEPGSDT